jgi:cytochrome b subunit of formate dehydrogenase
MNVKFDFIMHWLWTIVYLLLALSGVAMIGAKYGWILNYNISAADITHRVLAAVFVLLTFASILYEIVRALNNDEKKLTWFIFGKSGYQLFTLITSLIFIITGVIIWVCMDSNMAATAFALLVHELLTYIAVASVIWHIYKKSHALLWPTKKANNVKRRA